MTKDVSPVIASGWRKGARKAEAEIEAEKYKTEQYIYYKIYECPAKPTETGKTISRAELEQEFQTLKAEDPETYNYTFSEYLRDCLGKNGSLMEV